MTEHDIYAALTEIFRDVFDDDALELSPEMAAKDIPEWDSFNHINIIVAAKIRFGTEFNTSEIDELQCVGDFATLIERKLANHAPA